MKTSAIAAFLALLALLSFNQRGVLHGRPFVWSTGGASGAGAGGSGGAAGAGTGGAATGGAGTGGATGGSGGGSGACGNGTVDNFEECDGSDLQNATCTSLGFSGGSLSCSSSCQFDVSSCTGGTITPTVTASRTTCKAPCGVFFDATSTSGLSGGDYVKASWSWDFGDPASTQNKGTIGFNVAHVFDNPGTYHIVTRVRDFAGATGFTTSTVTVSAMTGTVYYVSTSGSDASNGLATTTPFLTFAHALAVAGTSANKSILLRNGDTFTTGNAAFNLSTITGPYILSNYSDPAHVSAVLPIIHSTASSSGEEIGEVFSSTDLRITNLTFVATSGASEGFNTGSTTDLLFENVEMTAVNGGCFNLGSNTVRTFFADVNMHDFTSIGIYADRPTGLSFINSQITNFTGFDHGIRVQGGNDRPEFPGFANNTYIGQSRVDPGAGSTTFDATTVRGDNTKTVEVQNFFKSNINYVPQNSFTLEHVQNVLCDGNTVIQSVNDNGGIGVTAQNVAVRNNVIYGTYQSIAIQGIPGLLPAGYVTNIFVQNNTTTFLTSNPNQTYFANIHDTTGSVTVQNNIYYTDSTSSLGTMVNTDGAATITNDHNLFYTPNATPSSPNVGTGGLTSNPQFVTMATDGTGFRLGSSSPAKDAGTNTHVYNSLGPAPGRPQNASWDMGAFERKNP